MQKNAEQLAMYASICQVPGEKKKTLGTRGTDHLLQKRVKMIARTLVEFSLVHLAGMKEDEQLAIYRYLSGINLELLHRLCLCTHTYESSENSR